MTFVIDSSVAFKWVVPEVDSYRAVVLRDDFRASRHQLLAPDIFPVELAHSLTRAERQRRIAVADAVMMLTNVLSTLPDQYQSLPLLPTACDISSTVRVGDYDCLYVALAESIGCQLITADDRLVRNLQTKFPFVVALASFP